MIAECAGRQGHFWDVHDLLFSRQSDPAVERNSVAGLDTEALESCLTTGADTVVRARARRAKALGIESTPSVLVGYRSGSRVSITDALAGLQDESSLAKIIERRVAS